MSKKVKKSKIQKMSISQAGFLAMEMTREALQKINDGNFHWWQADIVLCPEIQGRTLLELRKDPYFEVATSDETVRVINIAGVGTGQRGFFSFTSNCVISRFVPPTWDPWYLDVKIDDEGLDKLRFTYTRDPVHGQPVLTDWHAVTD